MADTSWGIVPCCNFSPGQEVTITWPNNGQEYESAYWDQPDGIAYNELPGDGNVGGSRCTNHVTASGPFSLTCYIPSTATPGQHTIIIATFYDAIGDNSGYQKFTVNVGAGSCGTTAIPVTLPGVNVSYNSFEKLWGIEYLPLPLQFLPSAAASDASCSFVATGTLTVRVRLGAPANNQFVDVNSVATATLDFLKVPTAVLVCAWTDYIAPEKDCLLGGTGKTLVRWHTAGFSEQFLGGRSTTQAH
jgi:hypothetical protein